jgi:hypothetical protein
LGTAQRPLGHGGSRSSRLLGARRHAAEATAEVQVAVELWLETSRAEKLSVSAVSYGRPILQRRFRAAKFFRVDLLSTKPFRINLIAGSSNGAY